MQPQGPETLSECFVEEDGEGPRLVRRGPLENDSDNPISRAAMGEVIVREHSYIGASGARMSSITAT